ncbi:hypothetical protein HB847_10635 [Listeria booriae]|uniref:CBM-cenC domain-containing protein n=1 Tax=Listeria booriae TaxID=1552123 RepID=A0A7X0Z5X1_9LIST|nr:hypothetical protein [Listeria booriae]MBC1372822.1 hypothetical protein [Listeria booriae]MBC2176493.1 hypothetical protein [Listeria booriae]
MKKKVSRSLMMGVLATCVVLSPFVGQTNALSTPVEASTIVFNETFDGGLTGWSYSRASVGTANGNKYIHLQAGQNGTVVPGSGIITNVGFIEKNISGLTNGKLYRVTFKASGVGNVSINYSDYINVNTGSVNMANARTYAYECVASNNVINVYALVYGSTMGIDDIKIEAL